MCDTEQDLVEIVVEDPTTPDLQLRTFTGRTEAEAEQAAAEYFGVPEAEERDLQ
ncbi:hypothetical protein ACNQR7_30860 [Mycolicibacterium senegalense]|uniref:hypothetical protein n=1 Tax=Mycolicibacterium senegalense TaxID=1796 RepID=UPI003AAF8761